MKDLDTAFSGYDRLVRQVNRIRTWTVTLLFAAVGIVVTGNAPSNISITAPAFVGMIGFLVLELRERSSLLFNKNEVLNLERIFMISDNLVYEKEIWEYEFRDLRLAKLDRKQKLAHLLKASKNIQVLFWYGFCSNILVAANLSPCEYAVLFSSDTQTECRASTEEPNAELSS